MLALTPAILLRVVRRPEPVKKLPRHRRVAIRDAIAELMKVAEPTAFSLEAPSRHGLRVALIFEGWSWGQADAEAALIVLSALHMAGARRPSWQMGQPEYCQPGVLPPPPRETCARCAAPLPEGARRYCSKVCYQAAAIDRNRRADAEERNAKEKVYRIAWSKRQPARLCPSCNRSFQPKRAAQKYCCDTCRHDARRLARRTVPRLCEAD